MLPLPELAAMLVLMAASGFFSCSEAALFSLRRAQRAAMAGGSAPERAALALLEEPERLLTAILFWNLVINIAYFSLASILTLRLGREAPASGAPQAIAVGSLVAIILCSELAPKSLGVLHPRRLSALVAAPLGAAVRALDPLLPWLQAASDASARVLFPRLDAEPYLGIDDLERAVEHGVGETHDDVALLERERQVLQRLVDLASASVAELMQPRRRCTVMTPPISLAALRGGVAGEYLYVTEPNSDEIAAALPTDRLALAPPDRIDRRADPVAYVPWCATAADALGLLRREGRRVAAIVNELGETVGVVTIERLLDAVLRDAARIDPADAHAAVLRDCGGGVWEASAATPLRRIVKRLAREPSGESLDPARSVTVGGLLQELLQRPPRFGDRVDYAGMRWVVTAGPDGETPTGADLPPVIVRIEPAKNETPANPGEEA